jgi:hypothetical protein
MVRLAAAHPGALREIDALPIDVIRRRIELLERAERDEALALPWMRAQACFHRVARGALIAKRWLRGRKTITAELRAEFAGMATVLGADALLVVDDLPAIARPPNGRISAFVRVKVAALLSVDVVDVDALAFDLPTSLRGGGRRS